MGNMLSNNFIYVPNPCDTSKFSCSVPLEDTDQLFLVDGKEQGTGKAFEIKVDKNKELEKMLQVVSIRSDKSQLETSFESNFIFEENSGANLLLCSHTYSMDAFRTAEIINVDIKEGARVKMVFMQNEHNMAHHEVSLNIKMASNSYLKVVLMSLHGGEIKNNIELNLNGEHAECDLSGLYLVDGTQKVENKLSVIHNAPNCKSSQLFKGILDDASVGKFEGIIKVVPNAQKTEAYQANHNLLISHDARINSEPQLEIYADDVKCSHGATTGRLDENELFYMRSRGISLKEAKLLQQLAFVYSVLEKIDNTPLREKMSDLTEKRLRGEFSACQNCSKNCC